MIVLKIMLIFLLVLWIYILWRRRKFYLLSLKIKGPWGFPIIGMAHEFIRKEEMLYKLGILEKNYGNSYLYSWLGPKPTLLITEPQIAQDILTSPNCVNKSFVYDTVTECIGNGLLTLKEPEWSRHRKLLNAAFNHKVLTSFMPIFNAETNKLIETLAKYSLEGEINILDMLRNLTLTTATRTTMGRDISIERSSNNVNLIECFQCVLKNVVEVAFTPWLKFNFVRFLFGIYGPFERAKKEITVFIQKLIEQDRTNDATHQEGRNKNFFLNLALEHLKNGDFDYKDVEDEANIIVFGAFETTANTIGYTLMLLAMFPEYQQKLYDEIKDLYPDSSDFDVTIDDTQQFIYMDMVIREAMRVMSPIPLIGREVSSDTTLSNGITLPAGISIAIDIFHMQRRKDIWGVDAHKFNPDNFLPSNLEDKHPFAFIPFTKGIRNCIGWRYGLLSMKVVLAKLIRNYSFKTTFNFDELQFEEDITLKLGKIPLLEVRRRNNEF